MISRTKDYDFFFNGNTDESGNRQFLLDPFKKLPNSLIISSNDGRKLKNKSKFNEDYFIDFANSKFGLCPHQMDWNGSFENMWTYRFIESCFVGAIPILFKETPLGIKFIDKFHFEWDDDIMKKDFFFYDINMANKNLKLAKSKFCFTYDEIQSIKETIKK